MPQLNQLADVALSQFFWLAIVLGVIYFAIGKGMLPKIQSTVDDREARIASDLKAAEAARVAADATEAAYRERMDMSRAEAAKLTGKAKAESAAKTEARLAAADEAVAGKVAEAEARIRAAREAAAGEIHQAAAELARDIARKVGGVEVGVADAAKAVKAVSANG